MNRHNGDQRNVTSPYWCGDCNGPWQHCDCGGCAREAEKVKLGSNGGITLDELDENMTLLGSLQDSVRDMENLSAGTGLEDADYATTFLSETEIIKNVCVDLHNNLRKLRVRLSS